MLWTASCHLEPLNVLSSHFLLAPSPHSLLLTNIQKSGPQLTSNLLLPSGDWGLQTLGGGSLSPFLALLPSGTQASCPLPSP